MLIKTEKKFIEALHNNASTKEDTLVLKQLLAQDDAFDIMANLIRHLSEWYQEANPDSAEVLTSHKTLLQYTHKSYPKRVYRGLADLDDDVITQFNSQLKNQKKIVTVSEHGADATTTSIKKAKEFAGYGHTIRSYLVLSADLTDEVLPNVLVVPPQYSRPWFNFWYRHVVGDNEYRGQENEVILEGPIPYKLSKTAGYHEAKKWLQTQKQ